MPKFVESPEAAEFPEDSAKLAVILDTVAIRHTADIIISKFRNNYGYQLSNEGHEYVGGGLYNPVRELRNFLEVAEYSQNSLVVAEAVNAIYAMDSVLVRDDMHSQWTQDRIEIDDLFEQTFLTQAWKNFVDDCDEKGASYLPQAFCEYHQRRLWTRDAILEEQLENKYQEIFDPAKEANQIFASDLRGVIDLAIKVKDTQRLEDIMALHFDNDSIKMYSRVDRDYQSCRNIEHILSAIHQFSPQRLREILNEAKVERNNHGNTDSMITRHHHIAIVASYVLKDWSTLYHVVSEDQTISTYKSYQLELLAKLLADSQIDVQPESREDIENFIVRQTVGLDKKAKIGILRTFQHPELLPECLSTIKYELNQNYFSRGELLDILSYLITNGSDEHKRSLVTFIQERLNQQLEKQETGLGNEDVQPSFTGERLIIAAKAGVGLKNLQILEDIIEVAHAKLGDHTFGAGFAQDALSEAIPYLVEHGNEFVLNNLVEMATNWYELLKEISVAKYIDLNSNDLEYTFDGIPVMLDIFKAINQFHNNKRLEVGEGHSLNSADVPYRLEQLYQWIARGIEIYYERWEQYSSDISNPLTFARTLLKYDNPVINQKVKMTLLSESLRQHAMGQYTAAGFYIEPISRTIGENWMKEEDILQYLSFSNLQWIAEKLLPQAKIGTAPSLN